MFVSVAVAHDDEFFARLMEKPLRDKIALKLNDLETRLGKVQNVVVLNQKEDEYCELLVQLESESE